MGDGTAVLERVTDLRATTTPLRLLESFSEGDDLPGWFVEQRNAGWQEFANLPMPPRKDQPWRFSNVDALRLDRYLRAPDLADEQRLELLERSVGLESTAARLVFADEQLVERDVVPQSLR